MRAIALLLLTAAAPVSAQTVFAGVGVADWTSADEMVALSATATAPAGRWTVGVHGLYAEETVLTRDWQDRRAGGALLAGRVGQVGAVEWTALAGPSLVRERRRPNVSPARPRAATLEPGVMARASLVLRHGVFDGCRVRGAWSVDPLVGVTQHGPRIGGDLGLTRQTRCVRALALYPVRRVPVGWRSTAA